MLYMALSLGIHGRRHPLRVTCSSTLIPAAGKTMNGVLAETVFSAGPLRAPQSENGSSSRPWFRRNASSSSPPRRASSTGARPREHGRRLVGSAPLRSAFEPPRHEERGSPDRSRVRAVMLYARGGLDLLVTMYAINVFLTFTLTELGMSLHWIKDRRGKTPVEEEPSHPPDRPRALLLDPVRDALRKTARRGLGDRSR